MFIIRTRAIIRYISTLSAILHTTDNDSFFPKSYTRICLYLFAIFNMSQVRNFLILFIISCLSSLEASIASFEFDEYPMSTVFYLSTYNADENDIGIWEQFPSYRKHDKVSFLHPEKPKKLVVISHAPGASRFAHTWLVPSLVKEDNIVICIEHRFFSVHELDFKELYSNILGRPYEIEIITRNILNDVELQKVIDTEDLTLITVDDSAIAGLLLSNTQLEPLKVKEHQKSYALWNLWGPNTSKDIAQVDWTSQSIMPSKTNFTKLVFLNPKGKQCAYAQSLNKIKTPTLIVSRNRAELDSFHEEVEYLLTHITNSKLVELPQGVSENIFYNKCGRSLSNLITPKCLSPDTNKEGVQKELSENIMKFINDK